MKEEKLNKIPEPISKFIIENIIGTMGADGMHYHHSDVCTLLKKYHKSQLKKLGLNSVIKSVCMHDEKDIEYIDGYYQCKCGYREE